MALTFICSLTKFYIHRPESFLFLFSVVATLFDNRHMNDDSGDDEQKGKKL